MSNSPTAIVGPRPSGELQEVTNPVITNTGFLGGVVGNHTARRYLMMLAT